MANISTNRRNEISNSNAQQLPHKTPDAKTHKKAYPPADGTV
jgi:hypothetical protein